GLDITPPRQRPWEQTLGQYSRTNYAAVAGRFLRGARRARRHVRWRRVSPPPPARPSGTCRAAVAPPAWPALVCETLRHIGPAYPTSARRVILSAPTGRSAGATWKRWRQRRAAPERPAESPCPPGKPERCGHVPRRAPPLSGSLRGPTKLPCLRQNIPVRVRVWASPKHFNTNMYSRN